MCLKMVSKCVKYLSFTVKELKLEKTLVWSLKTSYIPYQAVLFLNVLFITFHFVM